MADAHEASLPPDTDHRHGFMTAIITVTVLSVVIAWLRMYTRIFLSQNAWWDDYIMFAASFLTILTNGILTRAFELGLGRHIYYVPVEQVPECFKWLWAAEPTNLFALYAVRLSITLFFLRLIPVHQKLNRRIIWTAAWGLTVSDIYVSISYFIQCRPIQKVWRTDIPGKCLSDAAYAAPVWLYQAVSILADLALVSIPILMFRSLKLPTRTKIGVIALCCLGIFTCAIAIVKTALLPALFDHHNLDKTWSLAQLCFWAPMEICVGIICGSLPCLKPLYHHIKTGGKSSSKGSALYASGSASAASGLRSSARRYRAQVSIDLRDRSKSSEETILPKHHQSYDPENEPTRAQQCGGESSVNTTRISDPRNGILKTIELEFETGTV
ncbi:hypothetical protein BDV96DRAFT_601066 [Lophiotrema nucula]|uniref:Rhodopsin domain-containing protein n=1 Tax=Lophiotrema nucula TaxID=690887 RepID=A0A6A5Z2B2_9PLEO|nr:hypothetical protein BDV96DRAFT_601066 [Lophiotrema nucula]